MIAMAVAVLRWCAGRAIALPGPWCQRTAVWGRVVTNINKGGGGVPGGGGRSAAVPARHGGGVVGSSWAAAAWQLRQCGGGCGGASGNCGGCSGSLAAVGWRGRRQRQLGCGKVAAPGMSGRCHQFDLQVIECTTMSDTITCFCVSHRNACPCQLPPPLN